jgi:hypothetical protein
VGRLSTIENRSYVYSWVSPSRVQYSAVPVQSGAVQCSSSAVWFQCGPVPMQSNQGHCEVQSQLHCRLLSSCALHSVKAAFLDTVENTVLVTTPVIATNTTYTYRTCRQTHGHTQKNDMSTQLCRTCLGRGVRTAMIVATSRWSLMGRHGTRVLSQLRW